MKYTILISVLVLVGCAGMKRDATMYGGNGFGNSRTQSYAECRHATLSSSRQMIGSNDDLGLFALFSAGDDLDSCMASKGYGRR